MTYIIWYQRSLLFGIITCHLLRAIHWTNAVLLAIGSLGTIFFNQNFNERVIFFQENAFEIVVWKMLASFFGLHSVNKWVIKFNSLSWTVDGENSVNKICLIKFSLRSFFQIKIHIHYFLIKSLLYCNYNPPLWQTRSSKSDGFFDILQI